jgi:hypothetical protein
MEAELTALATSGATTVVGLMASDAWTQVRTRLARFFARDGEAGQVGQELELSRQELAAARAADDDLAAGDIEAEWRTRLRRTLRADPAAASELRLLLAELAPDSPQGTTVTVHNTMSGVVRHGSVYQGQNLSMTYGSPGAVPQASSSPVPPPRPDQQEPDREPEPPR